MKLITAIIQQNMLDQVHEALSEAGITRITVARVSGHGQQAGEEIFRGTKVIPSLLPKIRLDIAVTEDLTEMTCDTILEAARAANGGVIGDGKIFVRDLEECIRIRTGEEGDVAV